MLPHKILIVVGTRPNFIKVTQFKKVAAGFENLSVEIVHTGQHYDEKMAQVFFDQFGLSPDHTLTCDPGHPAAQIAEMITKLSTLIQAQQPKMVIVVGDVNSTLAAAIATNKSQVAMAHLESGLRSFDTAMPEEHNRLVADALAGLHFITEDSGLRNLRAEGKAERGLALVGNTMIDTLLAYMQQIEASRVLGEYGINENNFALVTIHRPSNVDSAEGLDTMLRILEEVSAHTSIVFPMHPRTRPDRQV